MQNFYNILFVSQGMTDETDVLKQALSIARNNKANLSVFLLYPEFSKEVAGYAEKYESSLVEKFKSDLQTTREAVKVNEADVPVTGISGFFIGNTAENIVQELGCSLLTLKPNGFVSPLRV